MPASLQDILHLTQVRLIIVVVKRRIPTIRQPLVIQTTLKTTRILMVIQIQIKTRHKTVQIPIVSLQRAIHQQLTVQTIRNRQTIALRQINRRKAVQLPARQISRQPLSHRLHQVLHKRPQAMQTRPAMRNRERFTPFSFLFKKGFLALF